MNENLDNKTSKKPQSYIDKTVDFIFSNNDLKWLAIILIIGFILRFIVVSNIPPVPDEMIHGTHAIGFINLNALSSMSQGPLWFFLTDLAYKIFNITLFSARFLSFFFGGLSIILVYLISKLLFNRKVAVISAFLLAVSSYHILWASVYMDEAMMFFILFAAYFFIKDLKQKNKISVLSAVLLGLASLIKIIAGIFIVVFSLFILFVLYKNYKPDKALFKSNFKRAALFFIIIFMILLPILSYNYFLYKSKGLVDLPFAMYFNINTEFYQGPGLAHERGFVLSESIGYLITAIKEYFIKQDPAIFILGILGVIFTALFFKNNKSLNYFLTALIFIPLIFIAVSILLPTHYTSFMPLFSIFAAVFLVKLSDYISHKSKINYKLILYALLIIICIINLIILFPSLTSKTATEKMRQYSISSIDDNTLVIVDPRIYRGTIAWMFNDKHYVEATILSQLFEISEKLPGQEQSVHTLFIECVSDDCGWGNIKDQPEFNQSIENTISIFKNISTKTEILGGGGRGEPANQPYFAVYETELQINPIILMQVDETHEFFFYKVRRYKDPKNAFDHYTTDSVGDKLLELASYLALYFAISASILSVIYLFYLLYKENFPGKKS